MVIEGLTVAGVALAGVALWKQYRDRPRLRVLSIRPRVVTRANGNHLRHEVSDIEVVIENSGTRPAVDCSAELVLAHTDRIPLHTGNLLGDRLANFTIQADAEVRLRAASPLGGPSDPLAAREFLQQLPVVVVVCCGKRTIRAELQRHVAEQLLFEEVYASRSK